MANLTAASRQLFGRPADERFENLSALLEHCQSLRERSRRLREPSTEFRPVIESESLALKINGHEPARLNNWSFGQLCTIAGVAKDTVNRLSRFTAGQVLSETLAQRVDQETDLQALVLDHEVVRSINGEKYRRLWSADLVSMLMEFAVDFSPPQKGINGATGLYAGEQDLFCFLIDPNGWTEIGGENFAPGFFVWNSEVGKRTVGVSTFWFQAICQNHIVWDVTEVREFTRKHTGRVSDSLATIRELIDALVARRDERKDGFARVIKKAMETTYGADSDEVQGLLANAGFTRSLAARAVAIAQRKGRFTVWAVVDALTQLAGESKFAGDRSELEQKSSSLLSLVA